MAGPHRYCKVVMVVVVCAVASTIAMPSADGFQEHPPAIAVVASLGTFDGGFPAAFADNLPTKGFTGDFARRVRRQAGITSAIDGILSSPYSGAPFSRHLQALLQRSTNIRPARQSPPRPSSPSRPSSPFRPSSPSSSRFPHNQGSFDRPQSQSFRPQEPRSPNTPSFSRPSSSFQPSRDSPHSPPHSEFSPPRFTPSFTRSHAIERVERPSLSQPFSSDSISGQQFASFSDIDAFFDSARVHRQRRDVAAAATRDDDRSLAHFLTHEDHEAPRQDTSGYISGKPSNFPAFAAIGGFGPMEEVDKTNVDGTFMEKFTFPSVTFGPIDDSHPPFPKTPTFHQPPSSSSFPQQPIF